MRGGLRWLFRPFQVTCVLVAVLPTAAFSLQSSLETSLAGNPGHQPLASGPKRGERLNADTTAVVSNKSNLTDRTIAYDPSDILYEDDMFGLLDVIGRGRGRNIKDAARPSGEQRGSTWRGQLFEEQFPIRQARGRG